MCFAITASVHVALLSGFAIMEHPACAHWRPEAASCWLLPELLSLNSSLHGHLLHIDQCTVGSCSKKPTTLWALNLPHLERRLHAAPGHGRCFHRRGHAVRLVGSTDVSGTRAFRTASAKQYPPGFCQVLALSISDFVLALPALSARLNDFDPDDHVMDHYVPLDPYLIDHSWDAYGSDFAGSRS